MNRITRFICIAIGLALLAPVIMGPAQSSRAQSPTGKSPKLLWTSERQAVLSALKDDPKWGPVIRDKANIPVPTGAKATECFGCHGPWQTLYYQMTGDVSYAQKAWQAVAPWVTPNPPTLPGDRSNGTRQGLMGYAWMYDWLKPALTTEQRAQYRNALVYWSKLTLGEVPGVSWAGKRLEDSDEVVGHYFGVMFTALTIADEDQAMSNFLINHTHMGGFDATGNSLDYKTSNMRNAIRKYTELAKGGEWLESSHYNPNTVFLLAQGYYGMKTATPTEHYADVAGFFSEAAIQALHILTPDLRDSFQWGDEQEPRSLSVYSRLPFLQSLAMLNRGNPNIGPVVNGALKQIMELHSNELYVKTPIYGFFLFYDPAIPAPSDWQTKLTKSNSTNKGLDHLRTGWGDTASFFTSSFMNLQTFIDHAQRITGDFQLYRKGEWAITHPIGYILSHIASNTMSFYGLGAAQEARGIVARETATDGSYAYTAGTTGGSVLRETYYNPPASFLHEWTRSFLYLPSSDKSKDTVVIFDRTLIDDPKQLSRWPLGYEQPERDILAGTANRKEWIIHMPESPSINGNKATWKTPKGQNIELTTVLPANPRHTTIDERSTSVITGRINPEEKKFQLRIAPPTSDRWNTFLSVLTASDQAAPVQSTLIESTNKTVQGVQLKSGNAHTLALFSAIPGKTTTITKDIDGKLQYNPAILKGLQENRLIRESFRVSTSTTGPSTVYIADLDPTQTWALKVNNSIVPFTVSKQGLGRATIPTTGTLNLEISANGAVPVGKAKLEVTARTDINRAIPGDSITYEVSYRNTGETAATHARFKTALPKELEVIESSLPTTPAASLEKSSNIITWTIDSITAGQTETITFQVKVKTP